jgi:hypothetical protein
VRIAAAAYRRSYSLLDCADNFRASSFLS